jgi:hypothetical protein
VIRIACVLAALTACTPVASRPAPFRLRPDSVEPGDLRGPFTGRVVDAASGAPVAGALVYATWTLQAGNAPLGVREFVTNTDANGHYQVPAIGQLPRTKGAVDPGGGRLTEFVMVVYKRGYVGYRSDRRFHDFGPRMDFAQTQNRVAMERWRTDHSHADHVRYLGSGAALASLTTWEVDEAAAELNGEPRESTIGTELMPGARGPAVVAAQLLDDAAIIKRTGYDGGFETGPLNDDPDTATYSSQHFKALGRPQSFDVAVRVWQLEAGDAQKRYGALIDSLPKVDERNEIANRSLRASENKIHGVAFLDGQRGIVVLITCGFDQCKNIETAVTLAEHIYANIKKLIPLRKIGLGGES